MKYYRLVNRYPIEEKNQIEWEIWYRHANRRVGDDTVGKAKVATAFQGVHHNPNKRKPMLFKTVVLDGEQEFEVKHSSTWHEAQEKHLNIVLKVRKGIKDFC